jgi:superfamily II DNA helicase RecQ
MIHHGHGRSMIDQCQEMGRVGRDGNIADYITIYWKGMMEETSWIPAEEIGSVIEWLERIEYRRLGIGRYLNDSGLKYISLTGYQ